MSRVNLPRTAAACTARSALLPWRWMAPMRLAMFALLGLGLAQAASGGERTLMPAQVPPSYLRECAACHMAYAPALLPAASWQRIMAGLERHYGVDASLDAGTVQDLSRWLAANGGTGKRATQPPEDRITRADWFERKHRRIEPAVWKLASVRGAANCAACHSAAARGDFDDDRGLIRPAGLDARQARAWRD